MDSAMAYKIHTVAREVEKICAAKAAELHTAIEWNQQRGRLDWRPLQVKGYAGRRPADAADDEFTALLMAHYGLMAALQPPPLDEPQVSEPPPPDGVIFIPVENYQAILTYINGLENALGAARNVPAPDWLCNPVTAAEAIAMLKAAD